MGFMTDLMKQLTEGIETQNPGFWERVRARNAAAGNKPGVERMKKGGSVKKMAKGGSVSSASKRADGCAVKGKTKGKMV